MIAALTKIISWKDRKGILNKSFESMLKTKKSITGKKRYQRLRRSGGMIAALNKLLGLKRQVP